MIINGNILANFRFSTDLMILFCTCDTLQVPPDCCMNIQEEFMEHHLFCSLSSWISRKPSKANIFNLPSISVSAQSRIKNFLKLIFLSITECYELGIRASSQPAWLRVCCAIWTSCSCFFPVLPAAAACWINRCHFVWQCDRRVWVHWGSAQVHNSQLKAMEEKW